MLNLKNIPAFEKELYIYYKLFLVKKMNYSNDEVNIYQKRYIDYLINVWISVILVNFSQTDYKRFEQRNFICVWFVETMDMFVTSSKFNSMQAVFR